MPEINIDNLTDKTFDDSTDIIVYTMGKVYLNTVELENAKSAMYNYRSILFLLGAGIYFVLTILFFWDSFKGIDRVG